ncbi:MAG: hypothetical protein ACFB0B_17325 [Thermonemataceae bacterium]
MIPTKKEPISRGYAFIKAIQMLFMLTPRQWWWLFRKQIAGEQTPQTWIKLLRPLAAYNQYNNAFRGKVKRVAWVSLWITLILYFFGSRLPTWLPALIEYLSLDGLLEPSWFSSLSWLSDLHQVMLALAVAAWVLFFFLKQADISDHLRNFLLPLIRILSQEATVDSQMNLRVALHRRTHRRFHNYTERGDAHWKYLLSQILQYTVVGLGIVAALTLFNLQVRDLVVALLPDMVKTVLIDSINQLRPSLPDSIVQILDNPTSIPPLDRLLIVAEVVAFIGALGYIFFRVLSLLSIKRHSDARVRTSTKHYFYPWLTFSLYLADDTLLESTLTERIRLRKRVKRNTSGKIKAKEKVSIQMIYGITLRFPLRDYAFQPLEEDKLPTRLSVEVKTSEKRQAFKMKAKTKQNQLDTYPDVNLFLRYVTTIYQHTIRKDASSGAHH